jgi:hypothetical protein
LLLVIKVEILQAAVISEERGGLMFVNFVNEKFRNILNNSKNNTAAVLPFTFGVESPLLVWLNVVRMKCG